MENELNIYNLTSQSHNVRYVGIKVRSLSDPGEGGAL